MTDAEIVQRIDAQPAAPPASWTPLMFLFVSTVLFVGVGLAQWSGETLALLVIALFLHECGHVAAMKLFRYKNVKMLFIPLFGAITQGEPQEEDACKIALIAFFGPAAGLATCLLALALWHLTGRAILVHYAYLAAALNLLNLLPIIPFDGGVILNEAVFSRYPAAELISMLLAGAVLVYFAAAHASIASIPIGLLGMFFALVAPANYKLNRAAARLRAEPDMLDGPLTEEKVKRMRAELNAANRHLESAANVRMPRVIANTWRKLHKVFPSPGATGGLLALYLATFLVGAPALLMISAGNQRTADFEARRVPGVTVPTFPNQLVSAPTGEPRRVLTVISPDYPQELRDEHVEGAVVVRIAVLADGSVSDPMKVSSPDAELTHLCIEAVSRWRYSRARKADAPPLVLDLPFIFRVPAAGR